MKLYIAESHKEKGYFITAQKDGKKGAVQRYRGIFAVYDEKSEKWHFRSQRGFTAKRDAKSWAEEEYADFNEKGQTATIASVKGRTNFAAFVEKHYRDYLENDRQLKGAKQEFQKLDVLVEFFGNDRIEDIDLLRVKEFKKWLLNRPYTRKEGGQEFFLSKTTSHRYLARLKHLLRYAADTLGTRVPPFRDLIKKSDEKPKGIKFTFDELQRMLAACDRLFPRKPENRRRWRLVLVAAYTLGCRVDELFHIMGSHIKYLDRENRVGLIELTMPDSRNKIHTKKMPITSWLFDEMGAAGLFNKASNERLFMWTKAYRKPFDSIKDEAKVNPQGTFHTLRATSATDKAASGQELETIQQEVGHRKGSGVTSRHYIHFEDLQIIESASPFNERLERRRKLDKVLDAETIKYPTGGEEHFSYAVIPTLSVLELTDLTKSANFGVVNRKVLKSSGDQAPYEWNYAAEYEDPRGYKVSIRNPDGTSLERFLHRGIDAGTTAGTFGYDIGLAGMSYEERSFDSAGTLISRKLAYWEQTELDISVTVSMKASWHPRLAYERSIAYDPSGNGDALSSTTTFEYDGDLNQRSNPLLLRKTTQFSFEAHPSGGSFTEVMPEPGEQPHPEPTPIPTPTPSSSAVKVVENTFLINDTNVSSSIRDAYIARNLVGLVTSSQVKDGAGTVVSRTEMSYDDTTNYPLISAGTSANWSDPNSVFRGNPNTLKVWDSTKGGYSSSSSYISTQAQFDNFGNQRKSWDAKGNLTETEYSSTYGFALPTKTISAVPDPSGTHGSDESFETTSTYNAETGLPLTSTDANGVETKVEYDPVTLRLVNTKSFFNSVQIGSTKETIYNDEVNNYWVKNRSQIDENNWAESITYFDGLGRAYKSEQVDAGGNIFTKKEFDAEGRVSRVSNPYRLTGDPCYVSGAIVCWTTNVYDNASRVIEVILTDGAKVTTEYGVSVDAPIGVTKQITDQAEKKRKGITNVLGQMVRVIEDPTGAPLNTDYVFDTLGNLRKTIQGEQSRYFYHDSLGRLLRAKQPEQEVNANLAISAADPVTGHNQWSVGYSYDDNGNILTTTDAKDQTVSATYDNLNRLKVRDYSDLTMPDVSFYYDGKYLDANYTLQTATGSAKGKTTGIKSSVSRTNYTSFDNLGRLLAHQQITDGQTYATEYTYNLSGALIEETYPSGRVVKNTLGVDADLLQVQSKKNGNYGFHTYAGSFTYDSAGAVTKMQLGNGRWETASYNNRLQITQIGLGTTDNAQDLLKLELGYGDHTQNNGSLREQTIRFDGLANPFEQTYTYDDLNRIESATETVGSTETWKQTFIIDRYGNRRFNTATGLTTTLGSCTEAVCNPTISTANNQFTSTGYNYDENGNLIEDAQGRSFVYDAENHQIEVKDDEENTVGEYFYDGEGRRVKKKVGTELTIFVYNGGGQLVAEYSSQITSTPQVSYLTADHLGSPRVITNENGVVTTRKDYTAFGEVSYTPDRTSGLGYSGAAETRKGYTGYEKDDESGLDFAQARYYNSTHGRFTSIDPLTASASIRNPQTFNRYSYVLNSPYKYTDPLGLEEECRTCTGASTQSIDKHRAEQEEKRKKEEEERRRRQQQARTPPPPAPNRVPEVVTVVFVTTGVFITHDLEGGSLTEIPASVPVEGSTTDVRRTIITRNFSRYIWQANLTMQLQDEDGNILEEYDYEVNYDIERGVLSRVEGTSVPFEGVAKIGTFEAFSDRGDFGRQPQQVSNDQIREYSGTVRIRGAGDLVANANFKIVIQGETVTEVSEPQKIRFSNPNR